MTPPSTSARGAGPGPERLQERADSWFVRHVSLLKTLMRVVFGVVWAIDGILKFQPGVADSVVDMINGQAQDQPAWLVPWFEFWAGAVRGNPGCAQSFSRACPAVTRAHPSAS